MKVYVDEYMYLLYYSFPRLISHIYACYKKPPETYICMGKKLLFGDYTRESIYSEELMVPSNSNPASSKGLNDIGEQNL